MKYLLERPVSGEIGTEKYKTKIIWRNGVLITDEPELIGGKDLGPDPYTLLLSSLVSCTLATLRMYTDLKEIKVSEIRVEANMFYKISSAGIVTNIDRKISIDGLEDGPLAQRLIRVAENCPISKILKGNIEIQTRMIEQD